MKLAEITNLPIFFDLARNSRLPIKTTYKLAKLAEIADKEMDFYRKHLQEIIDEYADKDADGNNLLTEDGQGVQIDPAKQEECVGKINELRDIDVDVHGISFILDDFASLELTLSELAPIMSLIEE